ncbi:MAG TPA: addiction module protein [Gemmataceae bacterium]|nr:addiction module protein [Gemmataceae bacterium]
MRDRFPEICQLGVEEKLQLVQDLWDDIADHHADEIPIPEWVWEEVERRHEKYLADPTSGLTWAQVEASILARHARKTDDPT